MNFVYIQGWNATTVTHDWHSKLQGKTNSG